MKRFISGSGELVFEDRFLSPRIVKEALNKMFHIVSVNESTDNLSLKIIRFVRLYGGPWIFPQQRINILIKKNTSSTLLRWDFVWPEYYVFLFSLIGLVVFGAFQTEAPDYFLFGSVFLIIFIIFLDTKWVAYRVRKVFMNLDNN